MYVLSQIPFHKTSSFINFTTISVIFVGVRYRNPAIRQHGLIMPVLYHRTSVVNAKGIIENGGLRVSHDMILGERFAAFYVEPHVQVNTPADALIEFLWTGPERPLEQLFDLAAIEPGILYIQGLDAKIAPVSGPNLIFRGIAIGYIPGDEPREGREQGQSLLDGCVHVADEISVAGDFKSEGWFPRLNVQQTAEQFFREALGRQLTVDWW